MQNLIHLISPKIMVSVGNRKVNVVNVMPDNCFQKKMMDRLNILVFNDNKMMGIKPMMALFRYRLGHS